jgi:hypothetical protein
MTMECRIRLLLTAARVIETGTALRAAVTWTAAENASWPIGVPACQ